MKISPQFSITVILFQAFKSIIDNFSLTKSFHFEIFNKSQFSATSQSQAFALFTIKKLINNIIKKFFSIFFY